MLMGMLSKDYLRKIFDPSLSNCDVDIEIVRGGFIIRSAKKEDLTSMKTPQEKAAELLPFVQALANGEEVLEGEHPATGNFIHGIAFSIKPKMMLVNGFEVPEPMRVAPAIGSIYYFTDLSCQTYYDYLKLTNENVDLMLIGRGICHATKEAAIAHAKAMLNIDPNCGE